VLQRGEQRAREVRVVKGRNGSRTPCLKGRGTFIDCLGAQRLRMSVCRGWTGHPGLSSWLPAMRSRVPGTVLNAAGPGDALLGC
jgi:hypothetical protein